MSTSAARTLTCPNCAAPATAEESSCRYCRSVLATASCGSCFGLLFEGAAFCSQCGARRDRVETCDVWHAPCPACAGAMTWVRVGGVDLLECDKCEGTWVEAQTFERLCADREAQAAVVHTGQEREGSERSAAAVRDARASAPNAFRYRPCPLCAGLMNRVNFGRVSGAVVDVCKGHGTFLDRGELNRIVRFIQSGGIDRLRAAEREQLADERRRLQDAGRMHARLFREGPDTAPQDTGLGRLLSALLGW